MQTRGLRTEGTRIDRLNVHTHKCKIQCKIVWPQFLWLKCNIPQGFLQWSSRVLYLGLLENHFQRISIIFKFSSHSIFYGTRINYEFESLVYISVHKMIILLLYSTRKKGEIVIQWVKHFSLLLLLLLLLLNYIYIIIIY